MKIHKQAQRRIQGNTQLTIANTKDAVLENKPVPEGDTIFLSSRTINLPDPKGQEKAKVIGREVTLKNGTQLTHDIQKKTVRMSHPAKPKAAVEVSNCPQRMANHSSFKIRRWNNGSLAMVE